MGANGDATGCGKEEKKIWKKRRKRYEEENFNYVKLLKDLDELTLHGP